MVFEVFQQTGVQAVAGTLAVAGAVGLGVWTLTPWVIRRLIAAGVYDRPNARSSHAAPTPRGGGLAVLAVLLPAWAALGALVGGPPRVWPVLALAVALGGLSLVDDLRRLPAAPRFAAQIAAVAAALAAFDGGLVFQGWLPLWADRALAGVVLLWFVNLFNFMDGIDGIAGVETLAVAGGLGLVWLTAGAPGPAGPALSWTLAAAAAGFLRWNWHPAKVFLGDVGSIPVGFLLGWLLLEAAAAGQWAAALILPAYYLFDATVTLLRRVARGARPWRAHREHAYQVAVQAGRDHAWVCRRVAAADGVLIACGLLAAAGAPAFGLTVAAAVVISLYRTLAGQAGA
jgi:UDP-N-acetylmuramyl pentapeptide phosphotransferase/UDP-N-acetylglucosamine-1-phosphate transferase